MQQPQFNMATSVTLLDATPHIKRLEDENANLKKENAELKKMNHDLQKSLLDHTSRLDNIQKSSSIQDGRILLLEQENQRLRSENAELKKKNENFKVEISSLKADVEELKKEKEERIQTAILSELALQLETAIVTKSIEGTEHEGDIYKFKELFPLLKDDETVSKNFDDICKHIKYDNKKHKKVMLSLKDLRLPGSHPVEYKGKKIDSVIIKNIAKERNMKNLKEIGELSEMLGKIRENEDLFVVDL